MKGKDLSCKLWGGGQVRDDKHFLVDYVILQRPLMQQAGNITRDSNELEHLVELKGCLAINGSLTEQIKLRKELERTQLLEQVSTLWELQLG